MVKSTLQKLFLF